MKQKSKKKKKFNIKKHLNGIRNAISDAQRSMAQVHENLDKSMRDINRSIGYG